MSNPVKPIKINVDNGELERFLETDDLPNQAGLDETRYLVRLLVKELAYRGFRFQSDELKAEAKKINLET